MQGPFPIYDHDLIDSTQLEAKRQRASSTAPFWVRAKSQTGGRGRSGKPWVSLVGNYYATLVYPWQDVATAPLASFVMAQALYNVLENYNLPNLAIKWPNDVFCDEHKIAGILLEFEDRHIFAGIGMNIASHPDASEIDPRAFRATHLNAYTDKDVEQFHKDFETAIIDELNSFNTHGFAPLKASLSKRLWVRSELVYEDGNSKELVRVIGIDDHGALEIEGQAGRRKIVAGDLLPR